MNGKGDCIVKALLHIKKELPAMKWKQLLGKLEQAIVHSGILLFAIGLLLGRAVILTEMSPFALPFFAAVLLLKYEHVRLVFVAIMLGASLHSIETTMYIFLSLIICLVMYQFVKKRVADVMKKVPLIVFVSSLSARFIYMFITEQLFMTKMMVAFVEAGLSLLLAVIFLQSMPLVTFNPLKRTLRNEEIICFIILLASILTGTIGWSVYDISLENTFARYFILLFAFIGGAAIGATVGVVIGLILSLADVTNLYQMSLLAFSGLLGGLLKDGKKFGVGAGLFVGTLLIGMYGDKSLVRFYPSLLESSVAFVFFLMTPKTLIKKVARYIPGTNEYSQAHQQYIKKIRDVTAHRVEQFSSLFHTLSNSFTQVPTWQEEASREREIDYYLSRVAEKSCQTCFRKKQCWVKQFDKTYELMKEIMLNYENVSANDSFDKHCIKPKVVKELIYYESKYYEASLKLQEKLRESQQLVAEQLMGVSQVMKNFAKEIQRESAEYTKLEDEITDALFQLGLEIDSIDIYSLESGQIDVEVTLSSCSGHGEGEKVIAPMLSDVLNEMVILVNEEHNHYPGGFCTLTFGSAKQFVVETGYAYAAKGGAFVSGDSYSMMELSSGKYAVAISDGMGNGERAHFVSKDTLQLLSQILQSGIDETVAIKSVNSVLSLRSKDDLFSTLDLAMIDLQTAAVKFLKIASSPSFVKRGDEVHMVEASNLPIGILQDVDVEVVSKQLKPGDLLIMMSDGVYDGANVENKEMWMKRKIREIETDDPQAVADLLLEEVIRTRYGDIPDDMTIIVAKMKRNLPKWKTIPFYSNRLNKKQAQ